MELVCIVESHLLDIVVGSVADVGVGLAWLGVDNAARVNVSFDDLFNFGLGGTVKASAKCRQELDDALIRVAFDRYKMVSISGIVAEAWLTIEWLDSGQVHLPTHVLSVDLAEISYEESIFVAGLAGIMIDGLNSLLQSFSNEFLWIVHAIVIVIPALFNIRTLCVLIIRMDIRKTGLGFKGCDGGR